MSSAPPDAGACGEGSNSAGSDGITRTFLRRSVNGFSADADSSMVYRSHAAFGRQGFVRRTVRKAGEPAPH